MRSGETVRWSFNKEFCKKHSTSYQEYNLGIVLDLSKVMEKRCGLGLDAEIVKLRERMDSAGHRNSSSSLRAGDRKPKVFLGRYVNLSHPAICSGTNLHRSLASTRSRSIKFLLSRNGLGRSPRWWTCRGLMPLVL